ncbi:MAG: hypothetical protein ABL919_03145 [Methylococcales bacterium]|nr:hypothetical protein [Methylococcaceae bacterium]
MSEVQEKDNFWLYIGGIILAAIALVVTIKSNEHDKYETTAKAIAEDPSYKEHKSENK